MLAMILSLPLQRVQVSISMPNTRFNRFAQLIASCRGGGDLPGSRVTNNACGAPIPEPEPPPLLRG